MLCGVGGQTIAAAKRSMSLIEARQWQQYRALRGRLNPMLRTELAFGRFAIALFGALGIKKKGGVAYEMTDFVPNLAEPVVATPENEMALILQKFGAR